MSAIGRDIKALIGQTLHVSLRNILNAGGCFDENRLNAYFSSAFQTNFHPEVKALENPSDATLAGSARYVMYECSFCSTDLKVTLRFRVDLSWMILDGEQIVYRNTFIPYEARLIVHVAGRKKEDVITDDGYFTRNMIFWRVEDAFEDRGIRFVAENALKAVERMRKKRARSMLQGIGMDLHQN